MRRLPDFLEAYDLYTTRTEPPALFHAWTGVSVIAAALSRNSWMDWDSRIYPNHFILLVGPAAARKGTAMRKGREILTLAGIPLASDKTSPEQFIHEIAKNTQACRTPSPPSKTANISPINVFSEEFVNFCRYDQGGFLQNLCDFYDCPNEWKYATLSRGDVCVEGLYLNLIGAITPKLIRVAFPSEAIGGGFSSRMILVYGEKKRQCVVMARPNAAELSIQADLAHDIVEIMKLQGEFTPDQDWLDMYEDWYLEQERSAPIDDDNFEHYIGRRQTHLKKLCMVFSASRRDDMILDAEVFQRAAKLLEATEKHMPMCFAGMGRVSYAEVLPEVINFLKLEQEVPYSVILGKFRSDLRPDEVDNVVKALAGAGAVRLEQRSGRRWVIYTPDVYAKIKMGNAKPVPGVGPVPANGSAPPSGSASSRPFAPISASLGVDALAPESECDSGESQSQ